MTQVVECNGKEILVRSKEDEVTNFSYLDVIEKVDVFPVNYNTSEYFRANVYMLQSHTGIGIGFVLKLVLGEIRKYGGKVVSELFDIDDGSHVMRIKPESFNSRTELMDQLCRALKVKSSLNCIKTWREEKYAVYVDHAPYILIERGLSGAFGIITYGVHVNGFFKDSATAHLRIWIPRRSASKSTWPSMLDNIVAGGIGYPCGIYETVLKECMEEASLSKDDVERNIKPVGSVSYFHHQVTFGEQKYLDEDAFITGEVEYLYDLELPPTVKPKPNDGEVEEFGLYSLQETINAIKRNEFKPNCALVMVEFLIRHGYITPENEPNYTAILSRMHRRLPFPLMR